MLQDALDGRVEIKLGGLPFHLIQIMIGPIHDGQLCL